MRRQLLNHTGTYAFILGMIVSCHPTRRPISVVKKQPTLKVELSGMNNMADPDLEYHLTGCADVEGHFEGQSDSVLFSNRILKKGLGGCVITVTSKDTTDHYRFKRGPGILWMSDEFAIAVDEDGLLTSIAKMEKTYANSDTPSNEAFRLKVGITLPGATNITEFFSYSGTLVCSDPIGSLHKNSGITFDQNLKAELIFADLKLPVDDETITCSEISVTAKLADKDVQFFKNLENMDNSFVPRGNQEITLNQGKPYNLGLRANQGGHGSSVGVEVSECPATQYFDEATNNCVCPGGTEFLEGQCVLPISN